MNALDEAKSIVDHLTAPEQDALYEHLGMRRATRSGKSITQEDYEEWMDRSRVPGVVPGTTTAEIMALTRCG